MNTRYRGTFTASSSRFIVLGAGGHGLMVGDLILDLGLRLAGYGDSDQKRLGSVVSLTGAAVKYTQQDFEDIIQRTERYPDGIDAVALGIGSNDKRLQALRAMKGLDTPSLVHPRAHVSPRASLGSGVVVFPQATVNAGSEVGDAVIVNSGAVIEHDCVVETAAHVSPGAIVCGGTRIGERAWVGAGATVIHGIRVGADAVIGAGSTVLQDVPSNQTVAGSPPRAIVRP